MNIKISRKEKFLSIYSVILVFILMFSEINDSTLLLSVLIIGTTCLLFNPVFILPVFIISSLGNNFFAYNGISISRLIGFILIFACVLYQIRKRTPIRRLEIIFLLIFFCYSFISSAFSVTGTFISFISFIQSLFIVFLLSQLRDINLNNLSWLMIISSVIAIILFAFWFQQNLVALNAERLTVDEDASINRLATMISQLTSIIFGGLLIAGKNKLLKTVLLSMIFIGLILIILTGTRAALISILGSIVIVLFYIFMKYPKKVLIYLPLIFLVSYLSFNQINQFDISLFERFTFEEVSSDGGGGRLHIWKTLIPKTIEDGLFFGFGFGAENALSVAKQSALKYSAHNFMIDMFVQMGISGLILFNTYFFILGKKLLKSINNLNLIIPIMILLTGIINGIGETVFMEKFFWNGIALAWLYLNNLDGQTNTLK